MVSIRENWTDITGEVTAIRRSERRPGALDVDVKVNEAEPVPGFADFLSDRVGSVITVSVDSPGSPSMVPGASVRMRIRRGRQADDLFAHTRHLEIKSS